MTTTHVIEDLLGPLPRKASGRIDLSELHALVDEGLPAAVIARLEKSLALSAIESVRMLAVSPTSRKRFKRTPRKRLDTAVSDRIVRLISTIAEAADIFGDKTKAIAWFKTPSLALGGERPLDLVMTDPGAKLVRDELGRIRYGHLA